MKNLKKFFHDLCGLIYDIKLAAIAVLGLAMVFLMVVKEITYFYEREFPASANQAVLSSMKEPGTRIQIPAEMGILLRADSKLCGHQSCFEYELLAGAIHYHVRPLQPQTELLRVGASVQFGINGKRVYLLVDKHMIPCQILAVNASDAPRRLFSR